MNRPSIVLTNLPSHALNKVLMNTVFLRLTLSSNKILEESAWALSQCFEY